ncbi:uncharacterized protein LOC128983185 isoform X2 [Macrosteles quadrilineatus]|uniref:uncharacterized protein LOC128983185 isoform X2 n=1 Tax=Macrosteles quadrilineatus TaxID=74068 RepID=UPI0023E14398|nr:uncharacterized protein LOC128983185 isoform X2 [Macrosteles quadrilineatus]
MRVKVHHMSAPITMIRSAPHTHTQNVAESVKSETEFDTVRELRLKLQHCQEENSKLQAVITDLTQVNKRWQKYNNDRQIYVQQLLNTIQDQQEQLNHIGERTFNSSSSVITQNCQVSSHSPPAEDEVERLRGVEQKLKEKVSILEFQVKAHRDDWEAELNEKKQALKDKEAVELKLAELLAEMQLPTPVGERREGRVELFCKNCGQVREYDRSPPPRSRMYRTAVHLPCSNVSSYHSSSTSISTTGDELVIDSSSKVTDDLSPLWNIKADETSYSRSSTVPLVTRPSPLPVTVKSFVQIPVVKSSSMPEGNASKIPDLPQMSLGSLDYLTNVPPVSSVHSSDQYAGVETLSGENVICLRCGQVFPPDMHLKFLDHFPKCKSNRKTNSVSKDSLPKV